MWFARHERHTSSMDCGLGHACALWRAARMRFLKRLCVRPRKLLSLSLPVDEGPRWELQV